MKLIRLSLASSLFLGLAALAWVTQKAQEDSASGMTAAAEEFLASLDAGQKARVVFKFDDAERTNWHFVPLQDRDRKATRKGLPLEDMNDKQRKAALALLRAGTSEKGYQTATTIMSLEAILREAEKRGSMVRNPDWYFFTIFGSPSKTGRWGWRVEGHHLCLNFTIDRGKVVSATPAFYGANPATLQAGPRKGSKVLEGAEVLAQKLFDSLDNDQKKAARQDRQFPEIEQAVTRPGVGKPRGLPAAKMNDKQKDQLWKLIEDYASRMPQDIARVELARVKEAGLDRVHFGFAREDDKKGKPYTYRVQGPTFVIEFLNVQPDGYGNPANHIHSAWRTLPADFGLDAK